MTMIKIVAISDTHENHHTVKFSEEQMLADLFIFAGDFSARTWK